MRPTRVLLAAALALAAGTLVPASPASGLSKEGFRVSREEPKSSRTYEFIPGQNGAGADAPQFGPEGCGTGGTGAAYCDAIPIEIVRPPEYDDYTAWAVKVTLDWQAEQVTDDSVQETQSNDLDMYFYFKSGEQLSTDGATGSRPETALFVSPKSDTYFIIVNNFLGANTGYSIEVEFVPEEILPAVREEDFARPRQPKPPAAAPRTTTTTMATTTSTATTTTLAERDDIEVVDVGEDEDFSGIAVGPDGGGTGNIFEGGDPLAAREDEEAPPASGISLVLWLVAFPLVLLAGAWWLVRRRSSSTILPT